VGNATSGLGTCGLRKDFRIRVPTTTSTTPHTSNASDGGIDTAARSMFVSATMIADVARTTGIDKMIQCNLIQVHSHNTRDR